MDEKRKCNRCNRTKPIEEFAVDPRVRKGTGKPGWLKHCLVCHRTMSNARQRESYDPAAKRDKYLKRMYGISLERFHEILAAQDGVCAICGKVPTKGAGRPYLAPGIETVEESGKFSVDHDHAHCGDKKGCPECVRGILCPGCNVALGSLDSVALLESAIAYLKEFDSVQR